MLLVRGNLVDGADFTASVLLERLALDHRVLFIDCPGFGQSDRQCDSGWTLAR